MGDVKRYTAWEIQQDQGGWKPVLEATDEFVRYDDYAALRARLAEVEKERDHNWSEYLGERDARMACNMREATWQARAERAEAQLATARRDALEEAAKLVEGERHNPNLRRIASEIRALDKDATVTGGKPK